MPRRSKNKFEVVNGDIRASACDIFRGAVTFAYGS